MDNIEKQIIRQEFLTSFVKNAPTEEIVKKLIQNDERAKKIAEYEEELYSADCIYPLTIVQDRYGGAYSGGKYTAWHLDFEEIPEEINSEDTICHDFWVENEIIVGKGNTPLEAVEKLRELIGW